MFVAFSVVGISLTAQEGRHHGDNCEWDPETFEVVCEDTPTPTPTEPPTEEPTEEPTTVTGLVTLGSGSATLRRGQSARVDGGWSPSSATTVWHITDESVLWRSSQCSGSRGSRAFPPEDDDEGTASLRVYGCNGGTSSVQLKVAGTG